MVLVNDTEHAWYTGALPALIRGDIKPEQARLNLVKIATAASATFIPATFTRHCEQSEAIQPATAHPIHACFTNHPPIACDILSLSTGGVKTENGVKPIPEFLRRLALWEGEQTPKIGIIGAGASGIEIALSLRIRLGPRAEIRIQSRDGTLLPGAPPKVQKAAANALQNANINIVKTLPAGLDIITAFTPTPSTEITDTLSLPGQPALIFATGDAAKFPTPLPRSGAIAVRQGRTLAYNLTHDDQKNFKLPSATLAILSLNSQQAIAWYGKYSWSGRLAMYLKNHLDKKWLSQ